MESELSDSATERSSETRQCSPHVEQTLRQHQQQSFIRTASSQSVSSHTLSAKLAAKLQAKKDSAAGAAPPPWPDETAYEKRTLFYFTLKDPIRRAAIFAIEWPKRGSSFWDKKVLFVIMANTMTMAMFDCFDKPSMRACDPAELNTPAGPYGYCNKMGTGITSTRNAMPAVF
jgi:hypothetical protein